MDSYYDVSTMSFYDYVQIGFESLQYSNFNVSYEISQSQSNSILRTIAEKSTALVLENLLTNPETPYDIKYFIVKNTDFLRSYNFNSDTTHSYEMLMDGYSNWAKPREYYLKKRNYETAHDEFNAFKKNNNNLFDFEVNVHCNFVFNLMNSNSTSYPAFKRKQSALQEYRYPHNVILEIQEITQTKDTASLDFFMFNHDYLYSLIFMTYNPVFVSDYFDSFVEDENVELNFVAIHSVLRQKNLSSEQIVKVYDLFQENTFVRFLIARHPNVPQNILKKLCEDKDDNVVRAAFTNNNLPSKNLLDILDSYDLTERRTAVRNTNLDMDILHEIIEDENEDTVVRFNALFNSALPDMYRKIWIDEKN